MSTRRCPEPGKPLSENDAQAIADFKKYLTTMGLPLPSKPEDRSPELQAAHQAFDDHLKEHKCDQNRGFGYCEEAMALFSKLPPEDSVLIG